MIMRRLSLAATIALVSCGPIQSGAVLVEAQAELAAAQTAQADKHAPFEYVAAEEYLHKAREEQSYSEFERAVTFARKSADCAHVARLRAEAQTRAQISATEAKPVSTSLRCRPGPDRLKAMLDPDQEPAAKGEVEQKPAPNRVPLGQPTNNKKKDDKKGEPKDPDRKPVTPKDETPPLPEGDQ